MIGPYEYYEDADGIAVYYHYPKPEGQDPKARDPYEVVFEITHRRDEGRAAEWIRGAVDLYNREAAIPKMQEAIRNLKKRRAALDNQ